MRNRSKRNGNKWTVNEVLALQREYELLEWTIHEISAKHKRSIGSILFKLTAEGFISSWNNARGFDIADYAVSVLCEGAHCDDDCDNDNDEDYVYEDDADADDDADDEVEDEAEDEDEDSDYDESEDQDEDEDSDYDESENQDADEDSEDDDYVDDDEVDADQGWSLKDSVTEIGNMVKLMFHVMSAAKHQTRTHATSSSM
jgi:hypothetical protein